MSKAKRAAPNPEEMLRCLAGLTGLKRHTPVGHLPMIYWDPKAAPALKGFYDLRALALRFLDTEFITAIRPVHAEQAFMFDAGLDAIGYVAFALSERGKYPGTQNNLRALHDYLLKTEILEFEQYDIAAFLIVLRAAREAVPALAAITAELEPVLAEERIFQLSRRRPSEFVRILRELFQNRARFARHLTKIETLNDAVAAFFPLLQHEPDENPLGYRALMEKIRATPRHSKEAAKPVIEAPTQGKKRKGVPRPRKYADGERPDLGYYLPVSEAITDRLARPDQITSWPIVPVTIKNLYHQHAREMSRAQKAWDHYARETWPSKSSMRWQIVDEGGARPLNLTQTVIDPFRQPLEVKLIEAAEEEKQTEAIFLFNLSVSMQESDRYLLSFMLADRFSEFLTRGGIPTEIVGHTTIGDAVKGVKGRNRAILYLLFKMREEPHNLLTIQRLCGVLDTKLHFLSYDGEALMWAYQRLRNRPAKHRLLFVVTDGDVSGTYINKRNVEMRNATADYFRDVVALIEAEKQVTLIGLPIKAENDGIFRRSVAIDSIGDIYGKLSPYVLKLLREFNDGQGDAAKARRLRMVAHRKARVVTAAAVATNRPTRDQARPKRAARGKDGRKKSVRKKSGNKKPAQKNAKRKSARRKTARRRPAKKTARRMTPLKRR